MFRHCLLTVFVTLALALPGLADQIRIDQVPTSADEFLALRERLATTPEGGAACVIATLLAFSKDYQVGMQCLTLILDQRNVGQGDVYKGHAPISAIMYHIDRISGYKLWPYLGFAYVKGATAANNYQTSPPYTVVTKRQRNSGTDESGQVKIFIYNDGFSPRPVTLRRNDKGIWKAYELSSMFLNVNPPASTAPKDDL
ncbi:MAG: hypothetical protein KC910_30450 [Candidatus Eremiobacteraeota bacterium]|nr:hypothetical protein [Candidatus Eremiobacteraeota bacterium]